MLQSKKPHRPAVEDETIAATIIIIIIVAAAAATTTIIITALGVRTIPMDHPPLPW